MLRRAARRIKLGLVLLGGALLLWLPVSLLRVPAPGPSLPAPGIRVDSHRGAVVLSVLLGSMPNTWVYTKGPPHIRIWVEPGYSRASSVGPGAISGTWYCVWIPLWLLAAVCLVWPVTSLLVRRPRRARGFEVEAKGGGS